MNSPLLKDPNIKSIFYALSAKPMHGSLSKGIYLLQGSDWLKEYSTEAENVYLVITV